MYFCNLCIYMSDFQFNTFSIFNLKCTCKHTPNHKQAHTLARTQTLVQALNLIQTYRHTHSLTHTHTNTDTHAHTHTHTHTHSPTHIPLTHKFLFLKIAQVTQMTKTAKNIYYLYNFFPQLTHHDVQLRQVILTAPNLVK